MVQKRVLNEIEEDAPETNNNKWGSLYKIHQDENDNLEDLDHLLSKATKSAQNCISKSEVKDEIKTETDLDCSPPTDQASKNPSSIDIKEEPCGSTYLPLKTTLPSLKEEPEISNNIVFKKRKAKNIRLK